MRYIQELQGHKNIKTTGICTHVTNTALTKVISPLDNHEAHSKEPEDQLPESKFCFDFMLSNLPLGVTWGGKDGYEVEARKLEKTRYQAGMPQLTMANCPFFKLCWPRCIRRRKETVKLQL